MGSLPLGKAGVGSAVNDTTRQMGGAVGVAVMGSVFASVYGSKVTAALRGHVTPSVVTVAKRSIGAALASVHGALADAVRSAFVDGFHAGLAVAAGVLGLAATIVLIWLPARARSEDIDRQHADYETGQALRAQESGAPILTPETVPGS
jgi:hypothetical protein